MSAAADAHRNASGARAIRAARARRPIIAIPGRFAASASGLRYGAVVVAERLAEAVFAAGGEPLVLLPVEAATVAERLGAVEALVLPGGGDLAPGTYGASIERLEVYGVDDRQDAFDLAACHHALSTGLPLLAICRGMQVLNVALGGSLDQHLDPPHRDYVHAVRVEPNSRLAAALGAPTATASCFHHQGIARVGRGLVAAAHASDGTIEALEATRAGHDRGYVLGVQWHPEDTYDTDGAQLALFTSLVDAVASPSSPRAVRHPETAGAQRSHRFVSHPEEGSSR